MMKKDKDVALELLKELKWEESKLGRSYKWLIFLLGFSQCRHCVNCEFEDGAYRGFRESFLAGQGSCKFSENNTSSMLNYEDLRKIHRCPGFLSMLYNFKDYAINPNEIKKIRSVRSQYFFAWIGWLVAIIIAILE